MEIVEQRRKSMSMWLLLGLACVAGGIGGLINSFLSGNGFALPRVEKIDGTYVVRPGFFGNIITGALAASISWGLYGPLSGAPLPGPGAAVQLSNMTLSA